MPTSYGPTAVESFASGYEAMKGVQEDVASQDILKQAYAGQTPEEIKDPIKQAATLNQAAGMLQSKGLNSAAYKLQKQAGSLSEATQTQALNDLKVKEGKLAYAGQLVQGATTQSDLISAIGAAGIDEATQLQLANAVKQFGDTPEGVQKAKALLTNVSRTASQNIQAQQVAISADNRQDLMDTRDLRVELNRIEAKAKNGIPLTEQEKITRDTGVIPKYQKGGKAAATVSGEEGDFLSSRAGVESGGFKGDAAYNAESKTSSAVGKYGLTKGTYDKIREEDPSLPEFSKLKGNKDAQDKAAKIHEQQISKEISAAGLSPTNANKDLWWRFGDTDAKKLVKADSDTPVKDVLSDKVIAANPDLQGKVTVGQAITKNLSGGGKVGDVSYETAKANKKADVEQMYEDVSMPIQKQIGDIAQVGKEFAIPPNKLVGQGAKAKVAIAGDFDVLKQTEKVSDLIAKNPSAVGTIASLVGSAGGLTKNLLDNVSTNKDNKYTEDVAILAKELATLGLQDAAASGGGRINQYLEKMFVGIYDKSLSPQSLVGVLKDRQDDAVRNLNRRIGADRENLDKTEYPLMFSKSSKDFMETQTAKTKEQDKKYGVDSTKERPPLSSFGSGGKERKFQFGQGDLSF